MRARAEIEAELERLAEGDSNDDEIDTLRATVEQLLDERDRMVPTNFALSFTPDAVIDHFDGEEAVQDALIAAQKRDPEKFAEICRGALDSDFLYREFRNECRIIVEEATGKAYEEYE